MRHPQVIFLGGGGGGGGLKLFSGGGGGTPQKIRLRDKVHIPRLESASVSLLSFFHGLGPKTAPRSDMPLSSS